MYSKNIVQAVISERINILLQLTKTTQKDLADALNISQPRISEIVRSKKTPNLLLYMNMYVYFNDRLRIELLDWCQFYTNNFLFNIMNSCQKYYIEESNNDRRIRKNA